MKLRTKVFAWILLTMAFVFSLLTVNLLALNLRRREEQRWEVAQLIRVMTQDWLTSLGPTAKREEQVDLIADRLLKTRTDQIDVLEERMARTELFKEWILLRPDFGILRQAPGFTPPPPEDIRREVWNTHVHRRTTLQDGVFVTRIELLPEQPSETPGIDSFQYVILRARLRHASVEGDDMAESFTGVIISMILGTCVLILTMYMLLERLVVKPLESLARASERLSLGDYTRPVKDTGSPDEIGELLRTFNVMQERLREYHETLEARVSEATNKVKGAERRLIVAQRLSATGTLAAGIAHEINNPLGGMLNAARALKREGLAPAKREQYLELIVESLLRIQDTVKKVLQFSPRKVNPQAANLREVLDRAIGLAHYKLDKKKVKLTHEAPDRLPNVFCDPSELVQVFLNLILNATDATEEEKGQIRVHYQVGEGEVSCTVSDNGCGMTEQELAQAFDIFYTTKGAEGTGLGLSVVYNIVQNHGGKIDVTSQKQVGTNMTVTLPVHREDQLAPAPAIPAESRKETTQA